MEFQTGEHMATLESITRGAAVRGILPEGLVAISDVRWIGTVAIEVTYKDSSGRLGKATSVNHDLDKLLALAKEPA